jgi:hypothetical protein
MQDLSTAPISYFSAQIHNIQMMAAITAMMLSFLLLAIYRRAVAKSMRRSKSERPR